MDPKRMLMGPVVWLFDLAHEVRRRARRLPRALDRRLRYLQGRIEGTRYRLAGRRPDPDVSDDILADRIRSSLGVLEKRLDVPRVHVMVDEHLALLHGDVPTEDDMFRIMEGVMAVSGVEGVLSFLHVGLLPSDTRPSEGRRRAGTSDALERLLAAADQAGASTPAHAVRATLAMFVDRLPAGERDHLLTHLPADVRALTHAPHRIGRVIHDVGDLVDAVERTGALVGSPHPRAVVEAIVSTMAGLVPEEVRDVAAVLPVELRTLWERQATAG